MTRRVATLNATAPSGGHCFRIAASTHRTEAAASGMDKYLWLRLLMPARLSLPKHFRRSAAGRKFFLFSST